MLYKRLESIKSTQMRDNLMQGDSDIGFLTEQALLYWEIETDYMYMYICLFY